MEPKKIKSVTVSIVYIAVCHEVMRLDGCSQHCLGFLWVSWAAVVDMFQSRVKALRAFMLRGENYT